MLAVDLEAFIRRAFEEDLPDGDHTSNACIPPHSQSAAVLRIKEGGILAGVEVAREVFRHCDVSLRFEAQMEDGSRMESGQNAFIVTGNTRSILASERLVLNLMQRMSGIATITNLYQQRISHTKAKVLDTRKTTPGLRWFEKQAVKIGGGENHRFSLSDMILIKDNHVEAAGGVGHALSRVDMYLRENKLDLQVELEVRTLDELREALDSVNKPDRIMLDNFSVAQTKTAVDMVAGRLPIESSGGITLDTIRDYAEAGVDYISVGALTHSVKSVDLSLKITQ